MGVASSVYEFQNSQSRPSFITHLQKPPLWAEESFQKTPQRIKEFYQTFKPQTKIHQWPQKSEFFTYQIDKDQSFQMDFSKVPDPEVCVHNFIFVQEGVGLYLFENESLPWVVNHIYLSPRSKVLRFKWTQRFHRSFVFSKLSEESCFFNFEINTDSKESSVLMETQGKGSVGVSRSLNLLNADQVVFEKSDHQQKTQGSLTRQFFRNVLGDKAVSRVHSMSLIEAQEVNSHQLLQSLLLSPKARSENKPELQVFKDQVQATHGSTTGTLQDLEVFYLNSRGIPKSEAQRMLIEAWVNKIFDLDENLGEDSEKFIQTARSYCESKLKNKLSSL